MTSYTKDGRRYEYSYNSDGMRTVRRMYKNSELTSTMRYIWDGDVLLGNRLEIVGSDEPITIRYLYDDGGELYGMDYNGTGYFGFVKNLQGDIVSIVPLDSNDDVQLNMEYDAWGKPIIKQASSAAEGLLMAMLMAVTNVGYRGYFYDLETGLYYLRSRYYDPETGRFINADDVEVMMPQKPTMLTVLTNKYFNLNAYSYCQNNPIRDMDDNGKISKSNSSNLTTKMFILILFSAAISDDKVIQVVNGSHKNGEWIKGQITVDFVAGEDHDFYEAIDALVNLYKDEVYEVIAVVALGKFKEQYSYPNPSNERLRIYPQRDFLFSKKCVTNEIKKHFEAYMWSIGKKGYRCPLMFKAYSALKDVSIKDACEKADILEMGPVYELAESIGFNYYDGIASVYKKTRKDPYYYPKENKRKRKPNSEWLYIAF